MRKLPLLLPCLLVLLLLSLLTAAASGQALGLPPVPDPLAAAAPEDEREDEAEDESELEDAGPEDLEVGDAEECEADEAEEEDLCEVAEEIEAEECGVEDATARLAIAGEDTVALVIRYKAFRPVSVAIDARLRGSRGRLHLGAVHTRFRRAGVFRDTFVLNEKRMEKASAAREFELELQAVNAPRYCRLELSGSPRRARRSRPADAPGRSGDRGRTRGKSARAHRR